ncbi:hypothetical protein RA307_31655 [Xanthobacteraceae bacterium Astr-EGSB]|uniref:hypothetical protein n=1 Tax=Astrobacterium formosum TaxID=3069710 RepID=UPI0027B3B773|nr:hypothetical protein [Xanthobacteraceae bacterium Astr-EGSB]
MSGRVKLIADQIRLATSEGSAGDLVFEPGTVGGAAGTVLRSALIGDLTVDTLQLENQSVTVPNFVTYSGPTGLISTPNSYWMTLLEDAFTVTAPAGSPIYMQVQSDTSGGGQDTDPGVWQFNRILLNDSAQVDYWALISAKREVRFNIFAITATGSPQTINLKWQIYCDWPVAGGASTYVYGGQLLRVALKR